MSLRDFAASALLVAVPVSLTSQAGQQSTSRAGWPCVGSPDPSYFHVAEASGGQVFLFDPSELAQSAVLFTARDRHEQTVHRLAGKLADGSHEFEVPVDSTIESLLFSISLQCLDTIEIGTPDGTPLRDSAEGVEWHAFQAGRIVTVQAPTPGTWRVNMIGRGMFFLVVQARSPVQFEGLRTVRVGGRPGHEGWLEDATPLSAGSRRTVEVRLSGMLRNPAFSLQSSTGVALGALPIVPAEATGDERTFRGEFVVPPAAFRVVAKGTDVRGLPVQRMDGRLLQVVAPR